MAYVLGYITADGCIAISRDQYRKNPFTLNITSAEKAHLFRLRRALGSGHKISKKRGGAQNIAFQLQIRNPNLTADLMDLGTKPRKTYHLDPIWVPDKFFADFVRGFFDGDGSVYIYRVNGVPQIKAKFISSSLPFIDEFSKQLCRILQIPVKAIHRTLGTKAKMIKYGLDFYIDDCDRLAHFMYDQDPTLYLPRKRRIFERWQLIPRRHYVKQDYPSKVGWRLNEKGFRAPETAAARS